jgi:nitrate reductase NapE
MTSNKNYFSCRGGSANAGAMTNIRARAPATRRSEILVFLLVTAVLFPLLAVAVVGGYGFLVWMYQLVAGPPGPPPA